MRILVDIVHPADVLFFRHPLKRLMGEGAEVLIASREKDVACDLLDEFGLPHLGLDCWSPNINIVRDPRWGRNLETAGEETHGPEGEGGVRPFGRHAFGRHVDAA